MFDHEEINKLHEVKETYSWIPDFVYGGIDGAVTTFAVVAGVKGADLSISTILILGFANLFADGLSMSIGKYLSDKAEIDEFNRIKKIEYDHLKTKRDHEINEVKEILENYNLSGETLENATKQIIKNDDAWVDLMMRNEFNMTLENVNPLKGGLATFVSFIFIGFIPLLGYVLNPFFGFGSNEIFIITCIFTLIALFIVGTIQSRFSTKNWFVAGLQTMSIGAVAAIVAYLVGYFLQGLA